LQYALHAASHAPGVRRVGACQTRSSNLIDYASIRKAWYVTAQIGHLLNKDYETAYSYHSSRRGAYVTTAWQQP
jgi:outer membrane cobalamin receptor